jgi:hypothetical protein
MDEAGEDGAGAAVVSMVAGTAMAEEMATDAAGAGVATGAASAVATHFTAAAASTVAEDFTAEVGVASMGDAGSMEVADTQAVIADAV